TDTGRRRAERRTRSREQLDAADDGSMFTNIRRWGAEDITWDEILSGTEWMNTGMSDRCGCDIWTAPGLHASEKSATAHEPGCGHPYYAESPDPPLHIWTDHDVPPFDAYLEASGTGTGTVTRLNAWAAVHYEGDIEAAMEKLNLFDDPVTVGLDLPAPAPYADPGLPPEQRADGVKAAKVHLADVMTRNLDLFDETEVLTKLAAFAEARKVGRWTLVGGVMVRTVAALHPSVVLPATIGGEVSLNLLLAQCGVPGSGKGASDNAVSDAAVMTFGNYRTPRLPLLPIGTGEGINRAYAHAVPVPGEHRSQTVFHRRHALFSIRDIVTLEKLADRAGATIIGELLKAYMGEELGFTNAGRETNVVLPQHSYRLGLLMGVQPNRASILLDAVARGNGLTHRILALPVTDLRKRSGAPETGTPVRLKLPADLHRDPLSDDMTSMPLDVPTAIAEALIEGQNAKNLDVFGESDSTPLSGHRGLSRLKLASTLAVMHGSTSAGGVFWEMAEKFTEVSDAMMDAMVAASEHSEAIVAGEQGRRDGHRRTASDDTYRLVMVDRVRERVLTVLRQQTDWMPHSRAANAVSKRQREYLPDAVAGLLADGLIESESGEYKGQTALRYRITSA
ncbi:MAG: DUF3987 domain-containing protein, partial [Actinomycetia bacterium]|nr:DUF3987 domain-containing protein [Actinomycetes bacterium]